MRLHKKRKRSHKMRDKDYNNEYDRERERERDRSRTYRDDIRQSTNREDYRPRESYPRESYRPRENYNPPSLRESYPETRDRDYGTSDRYYTDRYTTREPTEDRYGTKSQQPLYEPRYGRTEYSSGESREYAERDRTQWGYATGRSHVRCRDIMTRDVVACRTDSNIREVARLMRDEDTGAIPVLDEHNKVIGMVTDRDIATRVLANLDLHLDACTVKEAMSTEVYAVRPNDRLVDCIRKMADKQVRRILVTDDNDRLKGIISMGDVATEAEYDRELAEALEDISKPKSWFKRLFS
jgi:CBS domain-containing protein